jgi:hypothetical protein
MVGYFEELGESFKDLYHNPTLIWPYVLSGVAVIVGILLLLVLDLLILAPMMGFSQASFGSVAAFEETAKQIVWTPGLIATIVGLALLDIILLMLVAIWFSAGTLALVNGVLEGRRPSTASFLDGANTLFGRLLRFALLRGLLVLLAALPMLVFVALIFLGGIPKWVSILFAVLCLLLFILVALFLSALLFFGDVIVVREGAGAFAAFSRSVALLKTKTGHVLLSLLLLIGLSVVAGIVFGIFMSPFELLVKLRENPLTVSLYAFFMAVRVVAQLVIAAVSALFTFRMFKAGCEEPSSRSAARRENVKKSI